MKLRNIRLLAAAFLVGCLEVNAPSGRILSARLLSDGIELLNHSDDELYTFAADPDTLAVIDFSPCASPETCAGIPPGEAQKIPFDGITGYSEQSRDIVVLHWFLVPDGDGFKPDTIRGMLLRLR